MPRLARLEVWSSLQCAGGTRLAVLPAVAAASDTRRVAGEESLVVALPRVGPGTDQLLERRVLRTVFADDTFDEWRIQAIDERRDLGPLLLVSGSWPSQDLSDTAVVTRTEADGLVRFNFEALGLTVSEHLATFILPALTAEGATWFAAGTITPTEPVDLVYDWTTPWEAIQRIAAATGMEVQLRRNGTSGYLIDVISQVGSSATTLALRLGRNLTGVVRTRSVAEQATRVYPRGGDVDGLRASMRRARWKVTAVDTGADDVTLADPVGGDGPLLRDDQLNGYYLRRVSGTLDQITDSFVATQKVRVADASSYAVNQLVELRKTSGGADLTYLEDPAAKATYGLKGVVLDRPDIPETVNLCPNPAMRVWAGGSSTPPDSWTKLGTPTITKTTTSNRWRVGGQSLRIQSTADGQGVEVDAAAIVPTPASPYFSGFMSVFLISGKVRVELVADDGSITRVIPDGTDGKAWTNVTDTWVDLGVAGIDLNELDAGSTSAKLRVVQDGDGTAEFYVDGAQLTQTAGQQPFIEGSGGTQLWQEANRQLDLYASPTVRYDVEVSDLNRAHPGTWPTQAVVVGGAVLVVDSEMGVSGATRVIEVTRDLLQAADTKVVLSDRPEDLTDALVRPVRPRRLVRNADTPSKPVVTPYYARVNGSPYQIEVALQAIPEGCTIYYWTGLTTDAVPKAGSSDYNTYSVPFIVNLDASPTYNRVVAAYAVIGGRQSAVQTFQLPLSPAPAAPIALSEPVAGTLGVSWSPNAWVRRCRVYIRKHATLWPTVDGSTTAALDDTYFACEKNVHVDGGGVDSGGNSIPGGTTYSTTGWVGSDVARVIVVPIDELDNPSIARETANRTMAGAVSPALLSVGITKTSNGGPTCATGAKFTCDWTVSSAVTDGTHDVVVVMYINGTPAGYGGGTEANPDSVNSMTNLDCLIYNNAAYPKDRYDIKFRVALMAGATELDHAYTDTIVLTTSCVP